MKMLASVTYCNCEIKLLKLKANYNSQVKRKDVQEIVIAR